MTELRRDILLPLVVLLAIVVLTSVGAVALQARMAPAIERILAENLYSLEAAETMMVAVCEDPSNQDAENRFKTSLAQATSNVTEKLERESIEVLQKNGPGSFRGDIESKARTLDALVTLSEINRAAVVREDERAQHLGYAGAWAVVFLGAASFGWALIAIGRARRRLIDPLYEIATVLDAVHGGDTYRRCRRMPAPAEVKKIMGGIDELLDARALHAYAQQPSLRATVDRKLLLHFLEKHSGPTWILTSAGAIDAANQAGLALLASDNAEALRHSLAAAVSGQVESKLRCVQLDGTDRYLCEWLPESDRDTV